jgi:hypothetical protein
MFDVTLNELYWIAGFLEGEGSFLKCGGTIMATATQVQREPVDRLKKLLGGDICTFSRKEVIGHVYYRWNMYGKRAEVLMKMLFPMMSPRRQEQISKALAWYASCPGANYVRTGRKLCRKGKHPWVKENIYIVYSTGQRYCKSCLSDRLERNKNREEIKSRLVQIINSN